MSDGTPDSNFSLPGTRLVNLTGKPLDPLSGVPVVVCFIADSPGSFIGVLTAKGQQLPIAFSTRQNADTYIEAMVPLEDTGEITVSSNIRDVYRFFVKMSGRSAVVCVDPLTDKERMLSLNQLGSCIACAN